MQAETKQRREKPDLPREIYSIREYLQIIGQSRAEFYKEQKLGLGPLTIPMGRRKRGILAEDLRAVLGPQAAGGRSPAAGQSQSRQCRATQTSRAIIGARRMSGDYFYSVLEASGSTWNETCRISHSHSHRQRTTDDSTQCSNDTDICHRPQGVDKKVIIPKLFMLAHSMNLGR